MTKTKVITRSWWPIPIVAALSAFLAIGLPALTTRGADHLDAPFIKMDGRIDINDLYVFHPTDDDGDQDHDRTVLAMTVNPAAGAKSGTKFRPTARYEFVIDRDGDARADARVRATFRKAPDKPGRQRVTARWLESGNSTLLADGLTDKVHVGANDSWVFAGLADDPFFMDLGNFNNGATFCGTGLDVSNFFAGLNASAIVVEVPTDLIGDGL